MINGQIVYDPVLHGPCPGVRHTFYTTSYLRGRYWYTVEIRVGPELAALYVNGTFITKIEPMFPARAKAGVLAITGFDNLVLFKAPHLVLQRLSYGGLSWLVML